MEDELVIGARKTKAPSKESLNIERTYSLASFEKYIIGFDKEKVTPLIKEGTLSSIHQRFNIWRIFLKVFQDFTVESMV